ncbi:phage holin [Clostridium chauvoei]|uniref:Holin n=2 Tax=Clostridium chauvoei TaxID=46867 RepID=S6FNE3_9CLOT|nr:phage holin [Clostridium chauvoei]ATD55475.1 holin [Clostridium chauvoei]ATD56851.1 holin [Clostridium chauvoei]MBX7280690.1 holin [Clostridium chauvoei]MBX7283174.1 holin [Clostridium chauvoei]MBX7285731.1 holin [Clostridium chauvoei]
MKKFDWSRFKNYGLWVSILSLIPLILSAFGYKVIAPEYQTVTATILSILAALGVLNNPTTDNKWYKDDIVKIEPEKVIEENKSEENK